MNTDKLQVVLPDGSTLLTIREGKAPELLPIKSPVPVNIAGTIGSVVEFLEKRVNFPDQVPQERSVIFVDRENISISLLTNEHDVYLQGKVLGKLENHPKFKEFGVNTGKAWTPTALGLFFKMNRSFFSSLEVNMSLVTQLMNFTATVNNSIERSAKENGDRSDKFEQTVNSNLPKSFNLSIPIFKGYGAVTVEVETFAQVNGREVSFTLLSPGAKSLEEELRDKVIDTEVDKIKTIAPGIAIIEA